MPAPQVYYDIAIKHLESQLDQVDKIDAKVASIFGFASATLPIFAGLLSLTNLPTASGVRYVDFGLLVVAGVVYVVLVIFLYRAFRISAWSHRPNLQDLKTVSAQYETPAVQRWVANECITSYTSNEPLILDKARWFRWALRGLAVEAVLLGSAGGIALLAK